MTIAEAARFGDVVLVAIPFGKYKALPAQAFYSKVVIDAGNYYPERDGHVADLDSGVATSSELMARMAEGANNLGPRCTTQKSTRVRQHDFSKVVPDLSTTATPSRSTGEGRSGCGRSG